MGGVLSQGGASLCPGLQYLSPLGYQSFRPEWECNVFRPEWGSNILAQGRVQRRNVAMRRPGYLQNAQSSP